MRPLAITLVLSVALVAPPSTASAGLFKTNKVKKKKQNKSAKVSKTRLQFRKGVAGGKRMFKNVFRRRSGEHKHSSRYASYKVGQKKVWSITTGSEKMTMTETVAKTAIRNGEFLAEVHYQNGSSNWSVVARLKNGAQLPVRTTKIGDSPPEGTSATGPGMPAKLKVGMKWTNTSSGPGSSSTIENAVLKKIKMKDPNGVVRRGFEIETRWTTDTTVDGKKFHSSTTGRFRVLEGVGMVWSQRTDNGVTATNKLTGFSQP